jgi:6-phosphogluconate dehydrogenase
MQLGMIGLGRMGANMVVRLMRAGHECVVFDVSADAVQGVAKQGATGTSSRVTVGPTWLPPEAASWSVNSKS